MIAISSLSTEYLYVTVTAPADPTGSTIQFAIVAPGVEPSSWTSGAWHTAATSSTRGYTATAKILVGPAGSIVTSDGSWRVWVKVSASPDVPVRDVGQLVVT